MNLMSNLDRFRIINAWIEEFSPATTQLEYSVVQGFTDPNNGNRTVMIGAHSANGTGLVIQNYTVGNEAVALSLAAENWTRTSIGHLDISPSFRGKWTVQ